MINFFNEDIGYIADNQNCISEWVESVIELFEKIPSEINIIFTSDSYLRDINIKYLSKDYFTDIITFDYVEENNISGDLFISIERIKENALSNDLSFKDELDRVIIHGVLHLLGFNDKTDEEKSLMRQKEDEMLNNR